MPRQFRDSAEFIDSVIRLLDSGEYSTALDNFRDDANAEFVKTGCWDLIPKLCGNLTNENKETHENLYACSQQLLELLAKNATPEELVLEFLEQLDESDKIKFPIILKLLQVTLPRCLSNTKNTTEWCLNSIRSYLETIFKSEKEMKILKLKTALDVTCLFYKELISSIFRKKTSQETETIEMLLVSRLIQLCDLLLPGMECEIVGDFQEIQSKIINMVLQLMPDPLKLLDHVFERSLSTGKSRGKHATIKKNIDLRELDDECDGLGFNEQTSPFDDENIISNFAYGIFFHLLLVEKRDWLPPLVYSPKFMLLSVSFLTVTLLEKPNGMILKKGLNLLNLALDRLHDKELNKYDLCFPHYKTLLLRLNYAMVYSDSKENRCAALKCFDSCISCFDEEARYWLLFNFRSDLRHSGSLGHVIMMLKNYVSEFLNLPDPAGKFSRYYRGKLLFDLIKKYCFLTDGKNTDLVENADHIISSLNLLRFLVIRDSDNVTDIKLYIDEIHRDFLKPLKDCCSISKNHYRARLKDSEKSQGESTLNVEVNVQDSLLPKLTKKEEQNACLLSLNAIDVIESLLNRLLECIYESFSCNF